MHLSEKLIDVYLNNHSIRKFINLIIFAYTCQLPIVELLQLTINIISVFDIVAYNLT